jgi:hypothetical protein
VRKRLLLEGGPSSTLEAKRSKGRKKVVYAVRESYFEGASLQCEGLDASRAIGKLEGHCSCSFRSWLIVVLGVCPPPGICYQKCHLYAIKSGLGVDLRATS